MKKKEDSFHIEIIRQNLINRSHDKKQKCLFVVLKLPEPLAPIKCAVLPLVNKDGLPEKAQEIVNDLKFHFNTSIEAKDSIGKRYRRQDAIGTPFCVTVDGDTLTDNTVTLRYRDSMKQERVPIAKLREIIEDRVSITSLLKKLDVKE